MAAALLPLVCSATCSTAPWCMPSGTWSSTCLPRWSSFPVYLPSFLFVYLLFGFFVLLEFECDAGCKRNAVWVVTGFWTSATRSLRRCSWAASAATLRAGIA